jgi:hypothetical protein
VHIIPVLLNIYHKSRLQCLTNEVWTLKGNTSVLKVTVPIYNDVFDFKRMFHSKNDFDSVVANSKRQHLIGEAMPGIAKWLKLNRGMFSIICHPVCS